MPTSATPPVIAAITASCGYIGTKNRDRLRCRDWAMLTRRKIEMTTYTHILDLAKEAEPPADGILSRTIHQDDRIKAVVFGFGQAQELSEHTAAKPAMLFFVKGEANLGLGDD